VTIPDVIPKVPLNGVTVSRGFDFEDGKKEEYPISFLKCWPIKCLAKQFSVLDASNRLRMPFLKGKQHLEGTNS
jgi:hypothetical protein